MPRLTALNAELLATGRGRYLADLDLPGALEVAFVRSPFPHARLGAITGAGVAAGDLGLKPITIEGPGLKVRSWLALPADVARYVGEPVAAVWAEDRYKAEDLAAHVQVDYDPLALEVPQVLFEQRFSNGKVEAAFARAEHTIERTFRVGRVSALPMECRGVAAAYDDATGVIEIWTSTQVPNLVAKAVATALDLEESSVRVLVPHVGAASGSRRTPSPRSSCWPPSPAGFDARCDGSRTDSKTWSPARTRTTTGCGWRPRSPARARCWRRKPR